MTQRERQVSSSKDGGVAAPTLPSAAGHGPHPRHEPGAEPAPRVPLWEHFYQSASPAQQQEFLSLAGRQGLLYVHQLPPAGNGNHPTPAHEEQGGKQLLARLLAGHVNDVEPVKPQPVSVSDTALGSDQREAVARALSTPDLCLIQGLPGTGKTRVVAEIVTEAAAQGLRVLLLAPAAAAIDRVLLLAGARDTVCPVRCVGRDERAEALPPAVRAFTFAERVRFLADQSLVKARASLNEHEQRCQRCQQDETVLDRQEELADQCRLLSERLEALAGRRAACLGEVEREAQSAESKERPKEHSALDSFHSVLAALHGARQETLAQADASLAEVNRKLDERRRELTARQPELEALRPLSEAKQKGRWWTGRWWQATFQGDVTGRLAAREGLQKQAQDAITTLEEELRRLGHERTEAANRFQAERAAQIQAETGRRLAELDDQEAALRQEQRLLQDKWHNACQELSTPACQPAEMTHAAVLTGREAWRRQLAEDEERLAFTREWIDYLREAAATLSSRLPGYVNLVAATTTGLADDEHFGDRSPCGAFDLLVLEEAEQVTESEFLKLARRARRWILVGSGESAERGAAEGSLRPTLRTPAFFQKLWQHLHCDPRRLPYAWVLEAGRLCCQLRPLSADQRRSLECEPVADSPEIELRILNLPRLQPLLAEVVFPPAQSIQQAKEYIFKELQELPVQATGHSLRWIEESERLVLQLADEGAAGDTPVDLQAGVREVLARLPCPVGGEAPAPWHTCRVEFDRGAGWDRPRAEDWVRRHLGVRDLGRTVRLDTARRMCPPLAAFLAEILYDGVATLPQGSGAELTKALPRSAAVAEFVPVPPLTADAPARRPGEPPPRKPDNGRRAPPPRRPPGRGGAGLELDLTAPRHADRLPTELRGELPGHGFVNYLEAQAVVRVLESLAADPVMRERVQAWESESGDGHGNAAPLRDPAVAVLALYPAQAELIRRLIRQSPVLVAGGLPVEVDVPSAFRQREAAVVLVSLTRSHSHRAVNYGEGPQMLTLALTRARTRLILFGDVGTLARRIQWEGALDHLDEAAAGRERRLLARVHRYLEGQGRHPEVFHLREGSSP